jgi:hypothetical protein
MFKENPINNLGKPRKPVYGVGINDSPYITGYRDEKGTLHTCPYYSAWHAMLGRCYCERQLTRQPSYIGCTVVEEWKYFTKFRSWMETKDWKGKALDKDLLVQGNKLYGPDTCLFVDKAVNSLLVFRDRARGPYPLGVTLSKSNGYEYFVAKCSFYGKQKTLGSFKTPEEAAECYREEKLRHFAEIAHKQTDPIIKQAILRLIINT